MQLLEKQTAFYWRKKNNVNILKYTDAVHITKIKYERPLSY
jgi:hypothetical protein